MAISQGLLKSYAIAYWKLRDGGDVSDRRSQAHNDLLDALTQMGIAFQDREDAAQIGRKLVDGAEAHCVIAPPETFATLLQLFNLTAELWRVAVKEREQWIA